MEKNFADTFEKVCRQNENLNTEYTTPVGRENVVVFGLISGEISLSPPAGMTVITLCIRCDYLRMRGGLSSIHATTTSTQLVS